MCSKFDIRGYNFSEGAVKFNIREYNFLWKCAVNLILEGTIFSGNVQ